MSNIESDQVEIWKPVVGYEGHYEASNMGRVRSLTRAVEKKNRWGGFSIRRFKGQVNMSRDISGGYLGISLCGKIKLAHRIIAKAFIPNPNNLAEVNHIDGNKKNNVVSNLEWVSREQNIRHAFANGLIGPSPGSSTKVIIQKNGETLEFKSHKEAAEFIGCAHVSVSAAKLRNGTSMGWKIIGDTRKRSKEAVWRKKKQGAATPH